MTKQEYLTDVTPGLQKYVTEQILPLYETYHDQAHSRTHILTVIEESFKICERLDLFNLQAQKYGSQPLVPDMVYTIAAYHDIGICEGRELHHITSGRRLTEDRHLRQWFNEEEIIIMKEAIEDHRASLCKTPRSLYGKVVSEADKKIDPDDIIARTILYGHDHYPELSPAQQKERNIHHLHEKYGDGGYLHLQFEASPNAERLEELRAIIRNSEMLETEYQKFEIHPLQPFLPQGAKALFLGSFPPPQFRWCMPFYYPNWINDMWRILGYIYHEDKEWLVKKGEKKFDYEQVISFCQDIGLAIYDAAYMVKREMGNASDKFLKIMIPSNLQEILAQLPDCRAIVSTGGKSAETISEILDCQVPKLGCYEEIKVRTPHNSSLEAPQRVVRFYRMPSSSRAYPMSIENKAEAYRKMLQEIGML